MAASFVLPFAVAEAMLNPAMLLLLILLHQATADAFDVDIPSTSHTLKGVTRAVLMARRAASETEATEDDPTCVTVPM